MAKPAHRNQHQKQRNQNINQTNRVTKQIKTRENFFSHSSHQYTANQNETISNAMEIKARGGYIIGVNHQNNPVFDYFIKIPDTGDLNPVTQIIPIQILAYQLAVLRGTDPDKPRNLAKSVTVK